ncbi:MAG: hypothetical protein COU69_03705 [Candidatus Pacebacteria bacterium CG10_big_fil_rev_8_21_14_0_10_56_10]|nr:MAG: hypothetical protein COU69_03705 [Candidatus Pacebacteria bacterium CG10_big_fil_rev_8_21_14_0_10_56_10]
MTDATGPAGATIASATSPTADSTNPASQAIVFLDRPLWRARTWLTMVAIIPLYLGRLEPDFRELVTT